MSKRQEKLKKAKYLKKQREKQLQRRIRKIDSLPVNRFNTADQDALLIGKYEAQIMLDSGIQEKEI